MNNNCMNLLQFLVSMIFIFICGCLNLKHFSFISVANAQNTQQVPILGSQTVTIPALPTNLPTGVTPNLPTLPVGNIQTPVPTPTPTNLTAAPTPSPAPSATPGVTPTPTFTPISANDKKGPQKYYEFKSICSREENDTEILSSTVKAKRLDLLNTKLAEAKKSNKTELIDKIYLLLVREHLKQNQPLKAEELFKSHGLHFADSDQVLLSAEIDVQKGLIRQAKTNLSRYLELHKADVLALEKLAEIYNLLNNYTEAKIVYDDLVKVNHKKDYLEEYCKNSAYNADHAHTKIYCNKLMTKQPTNYLGPIFLGISSRDQELYPAAIKQFENSLKIKPNEFAATCLAESFYLNKNYDKALEAYGNALKIKPTSARAQLGLANTHIKLNQFKEALEAFKRSCKLGIKPLNEMTNVANTLRDQKSNLTNTYFEEIQNCKN